MKIIKGKIELGNCFLHYFSFGSGQKNLIIIPGLSVRKFDGAEKAVAWMFRMFRKDYRVYVFDKREIIPKGFTISGHAEDVYKAFVALKIEKADVLGVSLGGMIAQYLAINHPEFIGKMVLACTLSRSNRTMERVINRWIEFALCGKKNELIKDMFSETMYSKSFLKKRKWLIPVIANIVKFDSKERFINLAESCLTCNSYENLCFIKCPVLIIGGSMDRVVTGEASEEIARKIPFCEIFMYENLGHAAYEEAKDFNKRVFYFFRS